MSLVKWNCYWSLVTIQISPDFCFWKIEKKIQNLNKTLCFLKKMNTKHVFATVPFSFYTFRSILEFHLHVLTIFEKPPPVNLSLRANIILRRIGKKKKRKVDSALKFTPRYIILKYIYTV